MTTSKNSLSVNRLSFAIVGRVNAGKSTLLNALIEIPDAAKTSPRAGETKASRHYQFSLPGGMALDLIDTPGLSDIDVSSEPATWKLIYKADLIFHVMNASHGWGADTKLLQARLVKTGLQIIFVITCADLLESTEAKASVLDQCRNYLHGIEPALVSAKTGDGINTLKEKLRKIASEKGEEMLFRRYAKDRWPELLQAMDDDADSAIKWAAGRAAAIAIIPIASVGPLLANEIYMVKKIGNAYGLTLTNSAAKAILVAMGAAAFGLALAALVPGLAIGIASAVTYAAGVSAKAWCRSGGKMNENELRAKFKTEKAKAKHKR